MKKIKLFASAVLFVMMFTGCPQFNRSEDDYQNSNNMSGTLRNLAFDYHAGYVEDDNSGNYTVYLWGEEGKYIELLSDSNNSILPFFAFKLKDGLKSASYKVTTFGTGKNEIAVIAYSPEGYGYTITYFDSGTLKVKLLSNGNVSLSFKNCKTNEKNSSINGTCELKVLKKGVDVEPTDPYVHDLKGIIKSSMFKFGKGFMKLDDNYPGYYDVYLCDKESLLDETKDPLEVYPYINFLLPKNFSEKDYDVLILNDDVNSLSVYSMYSEYGFVFFSSGKINIKRMENNTVRFTFIDCTGSDYESKISGYCDVPLCSE